MKTLRAKGGIDKETGYELDGDYFGLPWPCWGTPEIKHPGSPNLYDTSKHVMEGGGNFRANFGVERDGVNLLAEDGSHSKGADLTTGYPEFDHVLLKKLGWWGDSPTPRRSRRRQELEDRPLGRHPARGDEARLPSVRQRQGARGGLELSRTAIPQHREPLYSTRPDMVAKYPTHDDKKAFWRLPTLYKTRAGEINKDASARSSRSSHLGPAGGVRGRRRRDALESVAGRVAAGDVRRDQSQGPRTTAASATASTCGSTSPTGAKIKVKALVTERVASATPCIHAVPLLRPLAGRKDIKPYYPDGADAGGARRAVNTATTYGYDSVTMMQETKTTVCQCRARG